MLVLGGGAVSYERGTPVGSEKAVAKGHALWGYNPMCKVTPVILHGVVSPGSQSPLSSSDVTNEASTTSC